jgi:asparagine synthase (glutamine-hydrolysing)
MSRSRCSERIHHNDRVCGITGLWSFDGGAPDAMRALVESMASRLVHRGPDGGGAWIDAATGVALGFRRLAIIDLSDAGAQPMASASGRFMIVFNGEVFNFRELRKHLESEGTAPPWRGHSDTEVLLACTEAWGLARAVAECIGMFAFALWDTRARTLALVRDRAGVKPLYYSLTPRSLLFASELKALEPHPGFDRALNPAAASLYAQYRYVPAPHSIYRGTAKLMPGSILTVSADGTAATTRYWSAADVAVRGATHRFTGSDDDAVEALDALLADSVARRMIADVPLGLFLSGGVDSSLIAALMQRNSATPIHTFTIGFEDPRHDEARYGREVARHLGTNHDELTVTAGEALALVPELPRIYDEPFADSSSLPTYLVSRLARRSATVALSGDGGDELFAGYHHHFLGARLQRRVRAIPALARPALGRLMRALPRTRAFGRALVENDPMKTYLRGMTSRAVISGGDVPLPLRPRELSSIEAILLHDFTTYLPDDILAKVDRASMAVGLEVRTPFLDHRVVELAWSLPLSMKIRADRGKWILRQLLRRYLPDVLIDREKQGFGLPLARWLRGPLRPWAEELLAKAAEPFDATRVRKLWRRHLGGENHERDLWTVMTYQAWLQR